VSLIQHLSNPQFEQTIQVLLGNCRIGRTRPNRDKPLLFAAYKMDELVDAAER